MALNLIDYTSYDMVRAVVGVSDKEVLDETLALPLYVREVQFSLEKLNLNIPTFFATYRALPEASRSLLQKKFINLVEMYAAYTAAKVLLQGSIELFAPRVITDGKAKMDRVDDPFATLRSTIGESLNVWAVRLTDTLALIDVTQVVTTSASRRFISSVTTNLNPVTGV